MDTTNKTIAVFILENGLEFILNIGTEESLRLKLHNALASRIFKDVEYKLNMSQVCDVYLKEYENEKPGFKSHIKTFVNV